MASLKEETQSDFSVFPNPSNTKIKIHLSKDFNYPFEIDLYSITSQKIVSNKIYENDFYIDVSGLESGVYWIKITNGETLGKIVVCH